MTVSTSLPKDLERESGTHMSTRLAPPEHNLGPLQPAVCMRPSALSIFRPIFPYSLILEAPFPRNPPGFRLRVGAR